MWESVLLVASSLAAVAHPLSAVSQTAYLTAAAGLVWMAAGVLLLLWGWVALSRGPKRPRSPERPRRDSRLVRAGLGSLIGAVATLLGTVLLGQGGAVSAAIGSVLPPAVTSFVGSEAAGFSRLFAMPAATSVAVGFARIGAFLWLGVQTLGASIVYGAGFESQFVVLNQVALATAVLTGALVGWVSFSSRWRYAGVATYLGLDLMALGFVALTLAVVESSSDPVTQVLGVSLVGTLLFGFVLFIFYQFYVLEHIAGTTRPSGAADDERAEPYAGPWPFVLVQVASYNEPTEIVKECLRSAKRLDYPADRFAVQLCDDSSDATSIRELEEFCRVEGVDFQHRKNRRGFKGGALNDGLKAWGKTVDLIAIVDSDYIVQPGFLRRTIPPFENSHIAFVQTPQSYRNIREGGVTRSYELADAYFYRVVQPVRARFQSLIFCGTMGVLRVAALEDAGGWSEACVTEDAELTIRLLARHWEGRYIPENLGAGLAPDLMTAVRSQQRRWAFGGIQMLKMHGRLLASRRLTWRQRFDFLSTGLFWFDGLFLVAVSVLIAGFVVASWFGYWLPFSSIPTPAIVAAVPVLMMFDGLVKIRAALRETHPVTFRDVFGVLTFWYAVKINDLRAAFQAWMGKTIPFARTPKNPPADAGRWALFIAAVRSSRAELTVSFVLLGIVITSLFVWSWPNNESARTYLIFLAWLVYYAYAFGSAFGFDLSSRMDLRRLRSQLPAAPASQPTV